MKSLILGGLFALVLGLGVLTMGSTHEAEAGGMPAANGALSECDETTTHSYTANDKYYVIGNCHNGWQIVYVYEVTFQGFFCDDGDCWPQYEMHLLYWYFQRCPMYF